MPLHRSEKTLGQAGESRKLALPKDRPSIASSREPSQQRGVSARDPAPLRGQENGAGSKARRLAAEALKFDMPNPLQSRVTLMKRQTSQSTDDEKENAELYQHTVKKESNLNNTDRRQSQQYDHDEDDTSLTFGSTGYEMDPDTQGQQTTIFRGDLSRTLAAVGSPQLQAEAARAAASRRGIPAMNQKSVRGQDFAQVGVYEADDLTDDDYDFDDEDANHLVNETPSRAGTVPVVRKVPSRSNPAARRVGFAPSPTRPTKSSSPIDGDDPMPPQKASIELPPHPEPNPHSSLGRHNAQREAIKHIPTPEPPQEPPSVSHNATAKVSAFDEAPQEELHNPLQPGPATTASKRPYDDIDHDIDELKTKSYFSLDEVPFLTDPRAPDLPAQVDTSGNPLQTLSSRLSNLSKMRSEDQKNLFLSLTDDENEQTGKFFIQYFSDNLKKLMEKRVERRKIALRYELEARKRQRAVEVKQEQCEVELRELKAGGSKLVEGRSADKIGMTPRKVMSMHPR